MQFLLESTVSEPWGDIYMHSFVLWPVLALVAAVGAGAATIEDSFHRSVVYWLVLPALLIGALAAIRF